MKWIVALSKRIPSRSSKTPKEELHTHRIDWGDHPLNFSIGSSILSTANSNKILMAWSHISAPIVRYNQTVLIIASSICDHWAQVTIIILLGDSGPMKLVKESTLKGYSTLG
jgi:hypothetical protein